MVYSSIAHAIFVLAHPFFDYEQSWDGLNYSFISDTSRGVVSFDKHNRVAVGAVRNEAGNRMMQYANVSAMNCFRSAPKTVLTLAEQETLEYMYCMIGRKKKKMITSACWLTDDFLCSDDSEEDFIKQGGEFLIEVLFSENLREHWKESYEWEDGELKETNRLFKLFKDRQYNLIAEDILGWKNYTEGQDACVASLEEIGFRVT